MKWESAIDNYAYDGMRHTHSAYALIEANTALAGSFAYSALTH